MPVLSRSIGDVDVRLSVPDVYAGVTDRLFEAFEEKGGVAEGMTVPLGWAFLRLKANEEGGLTICEIDFDRSEVFRWKPEVRDSIAIAAQQVKWYRTLGRAFTASARELVLLNRKALDDAELYLTRDSRDRDATLMVGSPDHPADHVDAEYVSAHLLYRMLPDLVHLSILDRGWKADFRDRAPVAVSDEVGMNLWFAD